MKKDLREKRVRGIRAEAAEYYKNHQIVRREANHWLLCADLPHGVKDSVEIVVLWEEAIVVAGNVAYAHFFNVGDLYTLADCQDAEVLAGWAERDDCHSNGPDRAYEWHQEIAYDDLRRLCLNDPPYNKAALNDAKDAANKYAYMATATRAVDARHFGEVIEYNDCRVPGQVIDSLVLYAHAAVVRLVSILKEEQESSHVDPNRSDD